MSGGCGGIYEGSVYGEYVCMESMFVSEGM